MTYKELCEKIGQEHNLLQTVIERKLQLFGHICRMSDNRKLKILLFEKMDEQERPPGAHTESGQTILWSGAVKICRK